MKKVAILMSTYNGEKYLKEQIDSLKKQTFKNWDLFIRDDGSIDNTLNIIYKLSKEDSRIHYIDDKQEHLKPMKSFIQLLSYVKADYYFFCDQDDYWLPQKLKLMLDNIDEDNDKPQLLYCSLKCVDQNLQPIKNDFENLIGKIHGRNRFFGNDMPGCVMLFNRKLRDMVIYYTTDYKNIVMHDWWLALIAETFGNVKFLNKKLILYRQHGDNSIGAGKNGSVLNKIFQKNVVKKQENLVKITYLQSIRFFNTFKKILSNEDLIFFNELLNCKEKGIRYRSGFLKKYKLRESSRLRTQVYKDIFIFRLNRILNSNNEK